jgi:GDP-D-mannose dehydratase
VNPRTALITGISGQDGSNPAEHLALVGKELEGLQPDGRLMPRARQP